MNKVVHFSRCAQHLTIALLLLCGLAGCAGTVPALVDRGAAQPVAGHNADLTVQQLVRLIHKRKPSLSAGMAEHIATYLLTYARKEAVDARLAAAIIAVESGFDTKAHSPRGAMGLGQLMPATARSLKVTRPFDAADNLAGTVRLLRQLSDAWRHDPRMVELVTASYRAGLGQVQRWQKGGAPLPGYIQEYIGAVNVWYRSV